MDDPVSYNVSQVSSGTAQFLSTVFLLSSGQSETLCVHPILLVGVTQPLHLKTQHSLCCPRGVVPRLHVWHASGTQTESNRLCSLQAGLEHQDAIDYMALHTGGTAHRHQL